MLFIAIFMHAMLAAIFPVGRAAALYAQPLFFTALRMGIAGIIFLGYEYIRYGYLRINYQMNLYRAGSVFRDILLVSIFGIFITNAAEFWALQFVPSAKASFIYSISPFFSAILSYFFFAEQLTVKKLLGMFIGFAGFSVMIYYDAPAEKVIGTIGVFSYGEIALICAALATVIGWLFLKRLVRNDSFSAPAANGITFIIGSMLSLGASFIFETWQPTPSNDLYATSLYIAIAVICSNLFGYGLYAYLLKRSSATFLSFVGFVEPFVAAFFGWIFLGEIVTWRFFVSACIVFVGLNIFYREELRQGYIIPAL